jgi:UDP-N-acetylglucosamine diphosphorylase/glucosamine-1-phosphate N-acetyltransferase
MTNTICIFEDDQYQKFFPLAYIRPVYNLKTGIASLKEKILNAYPGAKVVLHCRSYLSDYMRLRNPKTLVNEIPSEDCLFINGRVLADENLAKRIPLTSKNEVVYINDGQVVAAYVKGASLRRVKRELHHPLSPEVFTKIPQTGSVVRLISYPWELVHLNGKELASDFELHMKSRGKKQKLNLKKYVGVHFLNPSDIVLGEGTTLKPGVVLDAGKGPIWLGQNVQILPNSVIVGPVYIGDGSIVKSGATIYENTTIGPVCKVGGEIEGSIIHGYSNKQHAGFLGHAYIGAWCNLGAGTNNSDLKNNYSHVKVQMDREQVDTGLQFVGLMMGDHSKSAINSMFNTGTIVGMGSNIFGFGFPPKYVPPFSWGAAGETFTTFAIDKFIEVAKRVMARRGVELSSFEERLFKRIFDFTKDERIRHGMPT